MKKIAICSSVALAVAFAGAPMVASSAAPARVSAPLVVAGIRPPTATPSSAIVRVGQRVPITVTPPTMPTRAVPRSAAVPIFKN